MTPTDPAPTDTPTPARAEAAEERAVTWVPVTERLPAPLLRVMACYNDGRMTIVLRALHMPAKTWTCIEDFDDGEWDEETGNCYYPDGWYEAVESGEYAFIGPLSGAAPTGRSCHNCRRCSRDDPASGGFS